jgi:hypothetical protein
MKMTNKYSKPIFDLSEHFGKCCDCGEFEDCGECGLTQDLFKQASAVSKLEIKYDELKKLLGHCIEDMYKPSGKISKPTAIKLMKYMSDNNILKH